MSDIKKQAAESLSWLSLVAKALSFLQAILPAFFVAWNNSLTRKNAELQGRLAHAELKLRVKIRQEAIKNDKSTGIDYINRFLDN